MSRQRSHRPPAVGYPAPWAPTGASSAGLPDTLRDMGEHALVAVRRWADPRERELRKRRRARRRSFQLGTVSGLTTAGTVGLVVISAPAWAVVVLGGGAVALVTGTALTARRYLRLRGKPLPQAAFLPRKQPPLRSAARAPIARLVNAERALHGLIAHLGASNRLPREELTEMIETANSGAAALHALAADVVQMESAIAVVGRNNRHAADAITTNMRFAMDRLNAGIVEYEQVVTAASKILAVPESTVVAYQFDGIVADLRHAADRLDGWAQALTEVADRPVIATQEPPQGLSQ
ncbi:hypothetical protein [Nocardia sp. NPDC050710]|uniref:phage shock envelope stress response protein PspM n=1 Tax=Nocardia sp. NPDC050710 TaxID=3157220 RepID=UPI0033D973D2